MHTSVKRSFKLISLSALVALGVSAGPAEARTQSPILGNPEEGQFGVCFNYSTSTGRLTQKGGAAPCNARRNWIIPIVYDNAGNAGFVAAARGTGTGAVICRAESVEQFGGTFRFGALVSTVTTETLRSTVHAPGGGNTWLRCQMDPGTSLNSVSY